MSIRKVSVIARLGVVAVGIAFAGAASAAPSKAEVGAMLKKCSDEADAKGLTVQKGKGTERSAYRRQCMLKNGVAPRKR